jgi:hypothetical protein
MRSKKPSLHSTVFWRGPSRQTFSGPKRQVTMLATSIMIICLSFFMPVAIGIMTLPHLLSVGVALIRCCFSLFLSCNDPVYLTYGQGLIILCIHKQFNFFTTFSNSGEGSNDIPSLLHSLDWAGVVVSVFGSALAAKQLIGTSCYFFLKPPDRA